MSTPEVTIEYRNLSQDSPSVSLPPGSQGNIGKFSPETPDLDTIEDRMKDWYPLGVRVVVQTPFYARPNQPLFAIEVSPFTGNPYMDSPGVFLNKPPVIPLRIYTGPGGAPAQDLAVTCVVYSEPPFPFRFLRSFRGASYDMQYHLRVTANMGTSGYLRAFTFTHQSGRLFAPFKSAYRNPKYVGPCGMNVLSPYFQDRVFFNGYSNRVCEPLGYLRSDASMIRHMEIDVPFRNLHSYFDRLEEYGAFGSNLWYSNKDDQFICQVESAKQPTLGTTFTRQYIIVEAIGQLVGSGTTGPITIDIEVRLKNYKVHGFLGIPWKNVMCSFESLRSNMFWFGQGGVGFGTGSGVDIETLNSCLMPMIYPSPTCTISIGKEKCRWLKVTAPELSETLRRSKRSTYDPLVPLTVLKFYIDHFNLQNLTKASIPLPYVESITQYCKMMLYGVSHVNELNTLLELEDPRSVLEKAHIPTPIVSMPFIRPREVSPSSLGSGRVSPSLYPRLPRD